MYCKLSCSRVHWNTNMIFDDDDEEEEGGGGGEGRRGG